MELDPAAGSSSAGPASGVPASAGVPPVGPQSDAPLTGVSGPEGAPASVLARHSARVRSARKQELVDECHQLGLPGNINVPKATLQQRLLAFYRSQLRSSADVARGRGHGPRDGAPIELESGVSSAAGGLRRGFLGSARTVRAFAGPVRGDRAAAAADVETAAPHSPTAEPSSAELDAPLSPRLTSPTAPASKRPRAAAQPFHPPTWRSSPSPPRARSTEVVAIDQLEPVHARRRSHALASVRPARLDELLAVESELRRANLCVRGLPDSAREGGPELAGKVHATLEALTGREVPIRDCSRVGRYDPDRPRPVIVQFSTLADKVAVLRSKGVLYGPNCPVELHGIRVYHDLSVPQLDWKMRLRGAYDWFLERGIRAIWRKGYRLFALVEGSWTEFFPSSVLVR